MSATANKTPRTDAEIRRIENDEKKYEDRYDCYIALADFTRTLECELSAANEKCEKYRKDWHDAAKMWLEAQHAQLISDNAALRAEIETLRVATHTESRRDSASPEGEP